MRQLLSSLGIATLLFGLVACGGGTDDTAGSDGGPTTLKVGETAGVPTAFLQYGVEIGTFEKHGVKLEVNSGAGGAAAIPGVVSGDLDIGGSNTVSALLAGSRGLPLSIVASGTFAAKEPKDDFSAVLVKADSPIKEAEDLAGRTIAVNTLENIGDVTIKAALQARGVDVPKLKFVEIGFPDMLPALESGQVDAVWEIEPFVTTGVAQGNRPVLWPYAESMAQLQVGCFVASKRLAAEHPDTIKSFQDGIKATADAVAADPAAFAKALSRLQKVDPALADKMKLPTWNGTNDMDSLDFIAKKMREFGLVDKDIDVKSLVATGAAG